MRMCRHRRRLQPIIRLRNTFAWRRVSAVGFYLSNIKFYDIIYVVVGDVLRLAARIVKNVWRFFFFKKRLLTCSVLPTDRNYYLWGVCIFLKATLSYNSLTTYIININTITNA